MVEGQGEDGTRLVLEELIGERDSAVDAKAGERRPGVRTHTDRHVLRLVSNALEHRPGHVAFVVCEGEADQRSPRVVPPVRCQQASEGRHEVEAVRTLGHL